MRTGLLAGLILLSATLATAGRPAAAADYVLHFEAYYSGLEIAEAKSNLRWTNDHYAMDFRAKSAGLLDLIAPFEEFVSSDGRVDDQPKPKHHRNENVSKNIWIDLLFTGSDVEIVDAHPHPVKEEERSPVPLSLRKGSLDPLSAILSVGMSAAAKDTCNATVPVFDGRQRFDTVFKQRSEEVYKGPSGPADTFVCDFHFIRRGGYTKASEKRPGITGTVWIQKVRDDLPMLPVRMQIVTKYGTGYIHMVSAVPQG